ncbi:hypothetical protein K504DRAFT_486542 [Pleomassaria siparia CBS 279.74]|uniref:RING-type domain-containing protein n=1 Tax=Pleomassaria siparia CBS 279.74 TaxID=1314801 RepID=A0A6G1KQN1_9PLEO|nr:hypothetical protein K504DRAFT_486542 [Pleomassaria siparia CBS 279.74]
MAEGERTGLLDLEKELTCSICTDLLYQPLTLLDCLHTFCGACLKEWFQFQASTATSIHPYTCPSCRASVRTTQPNATVTTLLDMFIKANPAHGKSDAEKKLDREKFKPGDNVLPKLKRRDGVEEDRRLVEDVQQMSLREVGIPASNTYLGPPNDRRRETSGDRSRGSRGTSRGSRRDTPEASVSRREIVPPSALEHQSSLRSLLSASEVDSQEVEEEIMRQIMEEGLLDGIDLNNIDVDQEDEISERIAQAYRKRQAERARERRERRERLVREGRIEPPTSSTPPQELRSPPPREEDQSRRRPHGRSESGTLTLQNPNRPPVSRPGLISVANQGSRAHRRSSSQGSSSARRAERPASLAVTSSRQASSSANDLRERPTTSNASLSGSGQRRQSEDQRRSTLDGRQQFRNSLRAHSSSNPNSPRRLAFNIPASDSPTSTTAVVASLVSSPSTTSPPTTALPLPPNSRRITDPTANRQPRPANGNTLPITSPPTFSRSTTDPSAIEARSGASSTTSAAPILFPEPQISCNRCNKKNIEYELHYNCSRCDDGAYNLCLGCYRASKGCKHWYGFGWAALPRYEHEAPPGGYPPKQELPHILVGHRYRRPLSLLSESTSTPHTLVSDDDPAYRLESGVFCDICSAFANACYWKCDTCNEGAWGFCNDCVNQAHHCTHPLLPIAHKVKDGTSMLNEPTSPSAQPSSRAAPLSLTLAPPNNDTGPTTPPLTPRTASLIQGPGLITIANTIFRPLTFTTICNICTYPIPPSHTRYHCPKCNGGDYDICTSCYHKLVGSGRISKEDGMNGWRRCIRGHRMVVVGFEDRDGGQRRIVVKDLVGGFALREEETAGEPRSPTERAPAPHQRAANWSWRDPDGTTHKYGSSMTSPAPPGSKLSMSGQRFPPNGGVGLRVRANWAYFPADEDKDELGFPKLAEIREAEDINGDWFWGVYAGRKGLFPNYGSVIGGKEEWGGLI